MKILLLSAGIFGALTLIYTADMKRAEKNVYACVNKTDCELVKQCKQECRILKKNLVLMNCYHFCRQNGTDKERQLFQRFRERIQRINANPNITSFSRMNGTVELVGSKSKRSIDDDSCENSDDDFMQMPDSLEAGDAIQIYNSEGVSSELTESNDNFTISTSLATADVENSFNQTTTTFSSNTESDHTVTASEISPTDTVNNETGSSTTETTTGTTVTETSTTASSEAESTTVFEETTTVAMENVENDTKSMQQSPLTTDEFNRQRIELSSGVLPVGVLEKQKDGSRCPRPTPCAPKCAVAVDSNGCQICRCLWLSKECTKDSDCDDDSQTCDMGRCECAEGYVQNMELSGICSKLAETATNFPVSESATYDDNNAMMSTTTEADETDTRVTITLSAADSTSAAVTTTETSE